MASCNGTFTNWQGSHECGAPLYRCSKCGNIGCDQDGESNKCTNQAFKPAGYCRKCSALGTKEFFQ